MSLTVNQVLFIRDMTIKYKDKATRKRLKRKLIKDTEFKYLMKYYKDLENKSRIRNIRKWI